MSCELGTTEVTQGQFKKVMGTEPWGGQSGVHDYKKIMRLNFSQACFNYSLKKFSSTFQSFGTRLVFCFTAKPFVLG